MSNNNNDGKPDTIGNEQVIKNAKCSECAFMKFYTTGMDEYPPCTSLAYCSQNNWDNESADADYSEPIFCPDFEAKPSEITAEPKSVDKGRTINTLLKAIDFKLLCEAKDSVLGKPDFDLIYENIKLAFEAENRKEITKGRLQEVVKGYLLFLSDIISSTPAQSLDIEQKAKEYAKYSIDDFFEIHRQETFEQQAALDFANLFIQLRKESFIAGLAHAEAQGKIEAVEDMSFAEWCSNEEYEYWKNENKWVDKQEAEEVFYTTDQLYNEYKTKG